ncbi:MAG: DUF4340 domain-containing protein [Deltaproteobacteria bacterium]|nr:DUF4340 domain-containing protein [Deltaproteobacteria bacterium]
MNKTNMILIALLVVQGACIGIQQLSSGDEASLERGLLLQGVDADSVSKVVIEDGAADAEDPMATLVKQGDAWLVSERWDHPADAEKVDELLREIVALEIADVISTTGLHSVELEVDDDDYSKKVTLTTTDGERTLFFGTSGRGSSTHARAGGTEQVVAVRDFSTWRVNARPDGWVERLALEVAPDEVARLELAGPTGTLTLTRAEGAVEGTAEWLLSDGTRQAGVDGEDVKELLTKATKLSASKVLGPASAVSPELLRVTLTTRAGARSYALGPAPEADNYALAVTGGSHLLQIGKWAVDPLLNATFDALVPEGEAPEAPEGEAPE